MLQEIGGQQGQDNGQIRQEAIGQEDLAEPAQTLGKMGIRDRYVGEDLDVLLELCDRILVLCGGRVSGIVDGRTATKHGVGMLMTHLGGGADHA